MGTAEGVTRARLDVDPRLTRRVVEQEAEREVPAGRREALRALLEPIYRKHSDPGERKSGFEAAFRRLFGEWGHEDDVLEVVAEFPLLRARLDSLWLGCADRGESAGADLGGPDHRSLGLCLPPVLFSEPGELRLFVRRELLHVEDTLDPGFSYRPGALVAARPGAMENLASERLRLLWGTSVDGRLTARWPEYARLRDERIEQAERIYRSPEGDLPHRLVEHLWSAPRPDFPTLRRWAVETESLVAFLFPEAGCARPPVARSVCPLCAFPAVGIVREWDGGGRRQALQRIAADFPDWRPQDGACERCAEVYEVRAGSWL